MPPVETLSTPTLDVFISYAHNDLYDRQVAARISKALSLRNVKCFRDSDSIRPGDAWQREIEKALGRATHFVVILSAESEKKKCKVHQEIAIAVDRWRRQELQILPLRRSKDAKFQALAEIQQILCEPPEEHNLVLRWLGLEPLASDSLDASALDESRRSQPKHLAQLCDRDPQTAEFRSRFRAAMRAGKPLPQVFFLIGDATAQHDSLIARLHRTYLDQQARILQSASAPAVRAAARTVDWPPPWDHSKNREELLCNVFDEFADGYSLRGANAVSLTPNAFVEVARRLPEPVVTLCHDLPVDWSGATTKLLRFYLDFWHKVGSLDRGRWFVLFFKVAWVASSEDEDKKRHDDIERKIMRAVASLERTRKPVARVTLLPALGRVERTDVKQWFRDRSDDNLFIHGDAVCEHLFSSQAKRSMDEVEDELRRVLTELGERGMQGMEVT